MARNQKKIITLAITIITLSTIAFFYLKPNQAQTPQGSFGSNMILEISAIKTAKEKIIVTKELPARVNSYEISEIRPEISGLIEKIKFQEGSLVHAGQQLYQIDSSVQKAEIRQAQANLNASKSKGERFKKLLDIEGISQQEYDELLSEVAVSRANLANAKQQLDRTKVLAPISGTIGRTNFTVGALVTQNQETPLATITRLSPIYVDITQTTAEALKNKNNKNLKVSLLVDGKKYDGTGKLQFTQSFADESTDSVILRARFDNKDEKLIPGMFVTAKLHLKEYEAITIPQSAVNRNQEGNLMVFTINDQNIVTPKPIIADELYNNKWIVKNGLGEGELIVDKGLFKIKPGTKVKIQTVNPNPNFAK